MNDFDQRSLKTSAQGFPYLECLFMFKNVRNIILFNISLDMLQIVHMNGHYKYSLGFLIIKCLKLFVTIQIMNIHTGL